MILQPHTQHPPFTAYVSHGSVSVLPNGFGCRSASRPARWVSMIRTSRCGSAAKVRPTSTSRIGYSVDRYFANRSTREGGASERGDARFDGHAPIYAQPITARCGAVSSSREKAVISKRAGLRRPMMSQSRGSRFDTLGLSGRGSLGESWRAYPALPWTNAISLFSTPMLRFGRGGFARFVSQYATGE